MEPQYGDRYRELHQRHWWWRAREEALVEVLRRHVHPSGERRLKILDVGCGGGLFFDRLAEFGEVEGVEPDAHLVDPAGKHRAKISILPFGPEFRPQNRFDLVLMLDVLEHMDEPRRALQRVHGLLNDGGMLLLTVPAFRSLWTNHDVINQHRTRYRRSTLFPMLQRAKFAVAEAKYWYQWTFPAKLAVRFLEQLTSAKPAVPRVPPAVLNRFLFHLSRLEQKTLGAAGVPFGSTLMVLCTKAA